MHRKQIQIITSLLIVIMQACSSLPSTSTITTPTDANTPLPPTLVPTDTPIPTQTSIPLEWKQINTGQEFVRDTIIGIAFDPKYPEVICVSTKNAGFFISSDGGVSWSPILRMKIDISILSQLNANIFTPHDDHLVSNITSDGKSRLYNTCKGNYSGWCVSEDGGKNWRRFSQAGEFYSTAITFDKEGMIYLVCGQNICKFTPDTTQLTILGRPQVGFVTLLQISPHDPNTIYVAGDGLVVSRDGGNIWTKINDGLGAYFLQLEAGTGNSSILYLLSGECKEGGGRGGVRQLLYGSRDGGFTWKFLTQEGCYLAKDADGKILYRHGVPENTETGPYTWGWILRSPDNGRTWQEITNISSGIHTLIAHPEQNGLLYAYDNQVPFHQFVSTDYGSSWKKATLNVRSCYGATNHFLDDYKPLSIDPQDSNHVIFIEDNQVVESKDGCSSLNTHKIETGDIGKISSVAIDPNDAKTIYLGTDTGAYVSLDFGKSWSQINDGLINSTVVYSIVVDKDDNVYAATPFGIYQLVHK